LASDPGERGARTRRQELAAALALREWTFEQLRREFQLGPSELEDDLRHLAKSLHRGQRRLVATPPRCEACGFRFKDRAPARFREPTRCPRCRSEDVFPALLRID
jgi:predicted Zn-ribbon and HTH transcriptional regulator